eukprot:55800_1
MGGLLIVTSDVDLPNHQYVPTVGLWKCWIFYDDFPFLLPCLLGAFISANAAVWAMFQVKDEHQERLTRLMSEVRTRRYTMIKDNETDSDTLSIMDQSDPVSSDIRICNTAVSIYQTSHSTALPMLMDRFITNKQKKPLLAADRFNEELDAPEIHSLSELLNKTDLCKTLLCYVILAICTMMFREMDPVYMAQALTFDSQWIGYTQAWSAVSLLVFTFCFQPYVLRTFEHRNMGVFNAIMLAIITVLMPSIYWSVFVDVLNNQWIQLGAAVFVETLMVVFVSTLFVISMNFMNNSIPQEHCGKANGLAQSIASLVRAIGPVATGFIWSESFDYLDSARYSVYWAYVPTFVGFIWMAVHLYCNIKPEFQLSWEERVELKNRKMGIRTLGFVISGNVVTGAGQ